MWHIVGLVSSYGQLVINIVSHYIHNIRHYVVNIISCYEYY